MERPRTLISDYEKHAPRFMSEFGFQSFPDMRTIQAFTSPEDRTGIFTPVLLAHQKYDQGNTVLQ
jgi:beta-mannosidase